MNFWRALTSPATLKAANNPVSIPGLTEFFVVPYYKRPLDARGSVRRKLKTN